MSGYKFIYQEKCIIEAQSKEGKSYIREISLIAKEVSCKTVDGINIFFLEVEIENGQKREKESVLISDLKFVRDYFLKKLASLIDLVHPEKRIKIHFPEGNKYFKMRRAYCQNCRQFFKEFHGFYEGRIEKCPHCARLTIFKKTP
jgi:hypothetical protein